MEEETWGKTAFLLTAHHLFFLGSGRDLKGWVVWQVLCVVLHKTHWQWISCLKDYSSCPEVCKRQERINVSDSSVQVKELRITKPALQNRFVFKPSTAKAQGANVPFYIVQVRSLMSSNSLAWIRSIAAVYWYQWYCCCWTTGLCRIVVLNLDVLRHLSPKDYVISHWGEGWFILLLSFLIPWVSLVEDGCFLQKLLPQWEVSISAAVRASLPCCPAAHLLTATGFSQQPL